MIHPVWLKFSEDNVQKWSAKHLLFISNHPMLSKFVISLSPFRESKLKLFERKFVSIFFGTWDNLFKPSLVIVAALP
jgi:hypothetical protein